MNKKGELFPKYLPSFFGTLIKVSGLLSLSRCKRMNRLYLVNSRSNHRIVLRTLSDDFLRSSNSPKTGKINEIFKFTIILNCLLILSIKFTCFWYQYNEFLRFHQVLDDAQVIGKNFRIYNQIWR